MTKKADLMSLQVFALSVSSYTFLLRTKNMIIQKTCTSRKITLAAVLALVYSIFVWRLMNGPLNVKRNPFFTTFKKYKCFFDWEWQAGSCKQLSFTWRAMKYYVYVLVWRLRVQATVLSWYWQCSASLNLQKCCCKGHLHMPHGQPHYSVTNVSSSFLRIRWVTQVK